MSRFATMVPVVFLLSVARTTNATQPATLYDQLTQAVIRLETYEIQAVSGNEVKFRHRAMGTGFFVRNQGDLYVVTARHVAECDPNLCARVKCVNNETDQAAVLLLVLPKSAWVFHPDGGDVDTQYVDVAVQKIPWLPGHGLRAFRYEREGSQDFKENQIPASDPSPPDPVLVLGFPGTIGFTLREQRPFARFGIIAMKTGEEFLTVNRLKYAEGRCYVVDARVLAGNSGGPIMNQVRLEDPRPKLLGLVMATNDRAGYMIAEPVSRIREALDIAGAKAPSGRWQVILEKDRPEEAEKSSEGPDTNATDTQIQILDNL